MAAGQPENKNKKRVQGAALPAGSRWGAEPPCHTANSMSLISADTPMMRQFNAIKKAHPDCILFFRAGDFYEMFGEDAVRASEILQIALTTRNKQSKHPVPMCGVPYHAFEPYLDRLTAAGVKVAICEQMEDPALAKGVVRREVVRIVTPGTTLALPLVEADRNLFLAAVLLPTGGRPAGLALADLSTGQLEVVQFGTGELGRLWTVLLREQPREILLAEPRSDTERESLSGFRSQLTDRFRTAAGAPPAVEEVPASWFDRRGAVRRLTEHFQTANLDGFGVEGMEAAVRACGALLAYLTHTQKSDLSHFTQIRPRATEGLMWLDEVTLGHLEIFENASPGGGRNTLFAVLNRTRTPMGARLLRRWLGAPLRDRAAIEARLEAVAELAANPRAMSTLREKLEGVRDLERTIARVSLPVAGVADVVALRDALRAAQGLPERLEGWRAALLAEIREEFDPMAEVHHLLRERLRDEPSLKLHEGGYIAEGYHPELDQLRELSRDSRRVISELEAAERKRTGIASLKIRYNKVFGYYLEIPRARQEKIPPEYIRKQTLVNAERYTSLELEALEEKILGAEGRIGELEYAAFQEVRAILAGYARRMQAMAAQLATVDTLAALATVARENHYVRPALLPEEAPRRIAVLGGRHPVIERLDFEEPFVPNDLELDAEQRQIVLITGPNMAGKSTVMRQMALIQLMAQAGSFVPAESAELCLVDRIFTRVGASDNLSLGQSTFLMEMNEAANILNSATAQSLILLDEIGRGTSTYDGISIAWAMVEHLHALGALTLFATHYHELTQLAQGLQRLENFNIAIHEEGEHLVFTRKLKPGAADRSYGIQVARLAGLPEGVIHRAHEVMTDLLAGSDGAAVTAAATVQGAARSSPVEAARARQQLSFLSDPHPMLEKIRALELDGLSPRDALDFLYRARANLESGEEF